MKKSLLLGLLLSTGVWAAEEPMPESCQAFAKIPKIVAEVLDENNPAIKEIIEVLEGFSAEFQQNWNEYLVAKGSGMVKDSELQEARSLIEANCASAIQQFKQLLDEAIESKTTK